jgi:hypothetical protein
MRLSLELSIVLASLCCLAILGGGSFARAADEGQPVKYQRIGLNEYQNFLIGWDTAAQPQRFALIRSAAEYDQLFQPAAVNGSRGPFAPAERSYTKEQILLVARQMPAPDRLEAVFEVESLEEAGETLILKYRYKAPAQASYEVRNYVALRLPAKPYERVLFIENGKEAGELNLANGEWVKPAAEKE